MSARSKIIWCTKNAGVSEQLEAKREVARAQIAERKAAEDAARAVERAAFDAQCAVRVAEREQREEEQAAQASSVRLLRVRPTHRRASCCERESPRNLYAVRSAISIKNLAKSPDRDHNGAHGADPITTGFGSQRARNGPRGFAV